MDSSLWTRPAEASGPNGGLERSGCAGRSGRVLDNEIAA
jgi:hypothetical protein